MRRRQQQLAPGIWRRRHDGGHVSLAMRESDQVFRVYAFDADGRGVDSEIIQGDVARAQHAADRLLADHSCDDCGAWTLAGAYRGR